MLMIRIFDTVLRVNFTLIDYVLRLSQTQVLRAFFSRYISCVKNSKFINSEVESVWCERQLSNKFFIDIQGDS